MGKDLRPTLREVRDWMLSTLKHSCHVEYFLNQLDLGHRDPQRPHDIIGEGNKYCWTVIKGTSIQHRNSSREFFLECVKPSITFHRKNQYHHRMWNHPNINATPEDMKVGAVDTLCSLLEDRKYQGGSHDFKEIIDVIKKNKSHKVKWFWMVYSQVKTLPQPNLSLIKSLDNFPNIGIPAKIYERIVDQTQEAVEMLRNERGYEL